MADSAAYTKKQGICARPLSEWHEDFFDQVWWFFPMTESPYIGSPLSSDWPGYHTHFTPLPEIPIMIEEVTAAEAEEKQAAIIQTIIEIAATSIRGPGAMCAMTHSDSIVAADQLIEDLSVAGYVIVPRELLRQRHRQRGTVYDVLGEVRIQCPDDRPLHDNEIVRLYRDVNSGHYGARRHAEFDDGRFEKIEP